MNKLALCIITTFFITGLIFICLYFYKGFIGDPITVDTISILSIGICFIGITPFIERMVEELKP